MARSFDPALISAVDRMRLDLADTAIDAAPTPAGDALALPLDDALYAGSLARRGNDEKLATLDLARSLLLHYSRLETSASLPTGDSAAWANRLTGWSALVARLELEVTTEAAAARRGMRVVLPTRSQDAAPGGEYGPGPRSYEDIDRRWS